jgi:hypothetical protein
MRVDEAKTALERAGYEVSVALDVAPGLPQLFDVAGLARDVTEGQLVSLAHRHGAWPPAFMGAHTAGSGQK